MKLRALAIVALGVACAAAAGWISRSRMELSSSSTTDRNVVASSPRDAGLSEAAQEISLSAADRSYLWETENAAFQIAYKTGPALAAVIAAGDVEALAKFFATDFRGMVFESGAAELVKRPFAEWASFKKNQQSRRALDRRAFAQWLTLESLGFQTKPQVQLAVVDFAPVRRDDLAGPWQGHWILRMCGENGRRNAELATPGDKPGDLFPAPYAATEGSRREFIAKGLVRWVRPPKDFANDRQWISGWELETVSNARSDRPLMRDVTLASGIDVSGLHDTWRDVGGSLVVAPGGVYACDVNNDGLIDLLVTDLASTRLYINQGGGRFVDEAVERGLSLEDPQNGLAILVDLDNDGDEDLILGKFIFENVGGRFVRRGMLPLRKEATGFAAADYDRDGKVDVYVACAAPSPGEGATRRVSWIDDHSGPGNQLFRNLGGFKFADVTAAAHASAGDKSSFTACWLDADEDGWPDLYVINELGDNVLLVNQRNGTFAERHVGPKHDGFAMGLAVGDLDDDGRIDVYLGNMKSKVGQRVVGNLPAGAYSDDVLDRMRRWVGGNVLLTNNGKLDFTERPCGIEGGGWSYGPVLIDFDGDGRLDVYSTCGFSSKSRREPDG